MAGDWIAMRTDLARDPAVLSLSGALGIPIQHVVGCLHSLWSWADEQLADGHAHGVTKTFLDGYVGVTGFADELCEAGWLTLEDDGVSLPNWDVWMSKSAKTRLKAAIRKRNQRHASVTNKSRSQRDKSVTRGEERRGEEKNPPESSRDPTWQEILAEEFPDLAADESFVAIYRSALAAMKRTKPYVADSSRLHFRQASEHRAEWQRMAEAVIGGGWAGFQPMADWLPGGRHYPRSNGQQTAADDDETQRMIQRDVQRYFR